MQRAADGLVVNGSVNNAATSQFSMAQRFGNTASGKSRYNFSLYLTVGNSALSAKSYSFTGFDTPKPEISQLTGGFAVQGPMKIPHLLRNGPNIFIQYTRTQNTAASTTPGLVPDAAVRSGRFFERSECDGSAGAALCSGYWAVCGVHCGGCHTGLAHCGEHYSDSLH